MPGNQGGGGSSVGIGPFLRGGEQNVALALPTPLLGPLTLLLTVQDKSPALQEGTGSCLLLLGVGCEGDGLPVLQGPGRFYQETIVLEKAGS